MKRHADPDPRRGDTHGVLIAHVSSLQLADGGFPTRTVAV
jgi:hypothetical protein